MNEANTEDSGTDRQKRCHSIPWVVLIGGCVCQSSFHHNNKMPNNHFRRKKVHFGSQFWRFQFMTGWPCCFGPVLRQHLMEGIHDRTKFFTGIWSGNKERKKKTGSHNPFQGHVPSDLRTSHQSPSLKGPTTSQQGHPECKGFKTCAFGRYSMSTLQQWTCC